MNITEFLANIRFTPYATVLNSWDSFNENGSVLMQLWAEPGQRVRGHPISGAYLRVCCWSSMSRTLKGQHQTVGYNGRTKAILALEGGARGYAALSDAPEAERKSGVWARNADLSKVYPILAIERPTDSKDVFAILGTPIGIDEIK